MNPVRSHAHAKGMSPTKILDRLKHGQETTSRKDLGGATSYGMNPSKIFSYLLKVTILFVAYFITARIGLSFDAVSGFATLIWPPTGISLAALILYGYRMWPGIFLAAFLVNFLVGAPPLVAFGIGVGNTLGPLFATYMYRRIAGKSDFFSRLSNVLGLILFGGVISTMISASVGTNSLLWGGVIKMAAYGSTWSAWWIGDMLGIIIMAPLILTWWGNWRISKSAPNKKAEAWLIFISVVLVSTMAFWDLLKDGLHNFPASISYLVFLPLVWVALRFSPRLATAAVALLTVLAVWGTANGFGPFASEMLSLGLLYLQIYIGSTAMTIMILISVVSERRSAEKDLEELNKGLENKIEERTVELKRSEEKLVGYTKELEAMVAERTKELEEKVSDLGKLNKFMVGRELRMIELKEKNKDLMIASLKHKHPKTTKKKQP